MSNPDPSYRHRITRLIVASIAFLAGAAILIVVVFRGYLVPAYDAWRDADPRQKDLLSASSTLLLAVILVALMLLLIAAFGVRRYFFPAPSSRRTRTEYVDAWSESARRMKSDRPASDSDDE